MKKLALLITALLIISCIGAAAEDYKIFLNETYVDVATNDSLRNVTVSGYGSIVRVTVQDGVKAALIRNKGNKTTVNYNSVATTGKYIFIQSKVKINDTNSNKVAIQITDSARNVFDLATFATNRSIITATGIKAGTYQLGQWYDVTAKINTVTKMYDLYINGRVVLYRISLSAMANLSAFAYRSEGTSGEETSMAVKCFRIYSSEDILDESVFPVKEINTKVITVTNDEVTDGEAPPELLYSETFDSQSAGSVVSGLGYKNGHSTVQADPKNSENLVLQMDRSNPEWNDLYMEVPINQTLDSMVVQFDTYAEKLAAGYNLALRSADGKFLQQFAVGSNGTPTLTNAGGLSCNILEGWNNIALVYNFLEKTIDTYLNGEPVFKGTGFSNAAFPQEINTARFTIPLGESDVVYFDNLKVYTGTQLNDFSDPEKEEDTNMEQQQSGGVMTGVPKIKPEIDKFSAVTEYEPKVPSTYIVGYDNAKKTYEGAVCFVLDNTHVWLQNERYEMPLKPFMENSVLYVPVKYLGAALGMEVSWDEASRSVKLGEITIKEGESKLTAQGKTVDMRAPMQLIDGSSYVPLKEVVSDAMGKYYFQSFKGIAFVADKDLGIKEDMANSSQTDIPLHVMLMNYIIYERPNAERLQQLLSERFPNKQHPRVFATADDFARMKQLTETDETFKIWSDNVLRSAKSEAASKSLPTPGYDAEGLRMQGLVGPDTILNLYWGFYMTGERQYVDRAEALGLAMAAYPDWNSHRHFLETSNAIAGCGAIIDLFYYELSQETKETIAKAMIDFGISSANRHYYGTGETNWALRINNWNVVCSAGVTVGCLALMDEFEPELCSDSLEKALRSVERMMHSYAPEGGWIEGLGYWDYTVSNNVMMLSVLQTAMGSDFGLSEAPGFMKTGYFPTYATGNAGGMGYHDAARTVNVNSEEVFWFANQANDGNLARLRLDLMASKNYNGGIRDMLWYYQGEIPDNVSLPLDNYISFAEVATMRTDWSNAAGNVFVGMHAGYNKVPHGQLDTGTFEYAVFGKKFATDMGSDSYALPGYFENSRYYVHRAEGHNLYVVNPSEDGGQSWTAQAALKQVVSKPRGGIFTVDLYDAYKNYDIDAALRGFMLSNSRKVFTVQDEIETSNTNEVHWFWHTEAETELDDSGKAVNLTIEGKNVKLYFESNVKFEIVLRESTPLETSPQYEAQLNNMTNLVNLVEVIFETTENLTTFRCVAVPQGVNYVPNSEIIPIADWSIEDGEIDTRYDYASELTLDGEPINEFDPKKGDYTIRVENLDNLPVIDVKTPGNIIKIDQPSKENDYVALVEIASSYNPENIVMYTIVFKVMAKTTPPSGLTEIKPVSIEVSDEPQPDNGKTNLYDGDFGTRWAAEGQPYAVYDLGETKEISGMAISIYLGDQRQQNFALEISEDGKTYTEITRALTAGGTTEFEYLEFAPVSARYVKLQLLGITDTSNKWNSVTEFRVLGK